MNRPVHDYSQIQSAGKRRSQANAAKRASRRQVQDYPPGYFTALCWPAHDWPHAGWVPAIGRAGSEVDADHRSRINQQIASAAVAAGKLQTVMLDGSPVRSEDALARLRSVVPHPAQRPAA